MAAFAREHGVQLRPHAKSHKTLQIAERQRTAGSSGLTVAKLDEAEAFLDHGFDDLCKTFALDRGAHGMDALPGYGQDRQHGLVLQRLSEEHAVIDDAKEPLSIGARLRIVPNHACTVANLADRLVGVRAERVSEVMPVLVRGGGR